MKLEGGIGFAITLYEALLNSWKVYSLGRSWQKRVCAFRYSNYYLNYFPVFFILYKPIFPYKQIFFPFQFFNTSPNSLEVLTLSQSRTRYKSLKKSNLYLEYKDTVTCTIWVSMSKIALFILTGIYQILNQWSFKSK